MDLARSVLPFTIPAQLVFRALDDLHAVAEAARSLPDIEARLTQRVDELESRVGEVLALGERIDGRAEQIIGVVESAEARVGELLAKVAEVEARAEEFIGQVERLDERAAQVLAEVDRLDRRAEQVLGVAGALEGRAAEILVMGGTLEGRAAEVIAMGETLEGRAAEVAEQGGRLADALPALERALTVIDELAPTAQTLALTVEPLHGATERLGRIVDRLPDWPRARPNSANS